MPRLRLGFVETVYPERTAKRSKKTGRFMGAVTTTEVADILEESYNIVHTFSEKKANLMANDLEDAMAKALERYIEKGTVSPNPLGPAVTAIKRRFKKFLNSGEMERMGFDNIPTRVALREGRPSFVDTGLYRDSFTAWVE